MTFLGNIRFLRRLLFAKSFKMESRNLNTGKDCATRLIGLVQMTSTPDKQNNFAQASNLISKAKTKGANMVFVPECFDFVSRNKDEAFELAESLSGDTIKNYKQLASDLKIWLSLGGFHEKPDDFTADPRLYNTHIIINDCGEILQTYRKIHLFDLDIKDKVRLRETDLSRPGPAVVPPVSTPIGNVGLAICYDLRFSEQSIALTEQGADILTYPSAFTVPTGMAHWEVLLRARAIENQCYVVAAAQVGKHHDKRSSYGHAMVVDPWGCKIAECHDKPDAVVAELDLQYLQEKRQQMPVWQHRRRDLYGFIQTHSHCPIDSVSEYVFGRVMVPSSAVFCRTPLSYAFVNRKPVLKGHVLVSPVRKVERFCDMTERETSDLWMLVNKVSTVIESVHSASSLTLTIQDGEDAGQSIKHVHVHVLPRRPGDFQQNDDVYHALETHDKNVKASEWRTDEDMAQEAAELRKHFLPGIPKL